MCTNLDPVYVGDQGIHLRGGGLAIRRRSQATDE